MAKNVFNAKAERFLQVSSVNITTFSGGKQVSHSFDDSQLEGSVKLVSVNGQEVVGDVDLKAGPNAIKGRFKGKVISF